MSAIYLFHTIDFFSDRMKNRILLGTTAITTLLGLLISVTPTLAIFPMWDVTGTWNFVYHCTGGCSGNYPHTMIITSFNPATGEFSGNGYYNVNPAYTWTVTGEVSGNTVDFTVVYTGLNPGYTINGIGTMSSDGTTITGSATGPGQTFSFTATGSATAITHFTNNGWVPEGSKLVLNIVHKVISDEDSGNVGYWALDNYNKHVQVWQDPTDDTKFYVVARYNGKWQTFAGALSPSAGVAENKDATGTMHGGYLATFTATGFTSTFGNIGTKDYGGTKADVLLGTYVAGQTGPTTPFSFLSTYFTGANGFTYDRWGWTYQYKTQRWDNFDFGTTGDIVV
jgi:hypothetical protein